MIASFVAFISLGRGPCSQWTIWSTTTGRGDISWVLVHEEEILPDCVSDSTRGLSGMSDIISSLISPTPCIRASIHHPVVEPLVADKPSNNHDVL
ncbi:hypothetical protein KAZ93_04840 [Patescibacteria group bacterium]|nr:hypothetical protein [Patescibacteria group bacterium]